VYRVITYGAALEQITALPDEALNGYAEVLDVLVEVTKEAHSPRVLATINMVKN
jgi:hypothetical protein